MAKLRRFSLTLLPGTSVIFEKFETPSERSINPSKNVLVLTTQWQPISTEEFCIENPACTPPQGIFFQKRLIYRFFCKIYN